MCGIIGYAGHRPAVPLVVEGLRSLEYRGYDSSGVAFVQQGALHTVRAEGKLAALEDVLGRQALPLSTVAMGHTRWATHGVPAERNAHPHKANAGTIALVHNGIIENYQELKDAYVPHCTFHSETDTEVLVNLIAEEQKTAPDLLHAFAAALRRAQGAYAVCLMDVNEPGTLYAARLSAPLILGIGTGENFVASDIPAFLPFTRRVIFLDDGEIVKISATSYEIMRLEDLQNVEKHISDITWDMQAAQKDGYKHFMLKEIFEQPRVINDALVGRLHSNRVVLPELEAMPVPKRMTIVACGTSYNAGLWAKHIFEEWAHIPVHVEIASEFRYGQVLLDKDDVAIVISQSGETADTLAALRAIKQKGALCMGLCNVVGSSIARESSVVFYTQAGPEISVASTKAMCSQMLLLSLMALYFSQRKQTLSQEECMAYIEALKALPEQLESALPSMRSEAQKLATIYAKSKSFFFLGRGHCFPMALEGALKLKELSYIHAEGYASGEMKHGPIALIDPHFPTFALALDDHIFPKAKSNILEVHARRGNIIALVNGSQGKNELAVIAKHGGYVWEIPMTKGMLAGFFTLPAVQLFSYEMADYLGTDVDQPRNLAKSVTVE